MMRSQRVNDSSATMMDHIAELRTRFFVVAVVFIASSALAYVFRDQLIQLLLSPLGEQKLIYLNPAGGFNFIFLISIYTGLAFITPLLIQQLYSFVKPALPKAAQKYSGVIFLSSLILLIAGIVFGYIFAIPGALHFLYSFASDYVVASLTADSYLNFMIAYTVGLGLVFQLPLLLLLIHWIRPMTPGGLFKSERWVIVLAFVAAALITPTPDPLNQTIIALPIITIYQLGVVAVLMSIRKSRRSHKQTTQPIRGTTKQRPVLHPRPAVASITPAQIIRKQASSQTRSSIDGFIVPSAVILRPVPKLYSDADHTPSPASSPTPRAGSSRFCMDGISPRRSGLAT